ncbi:MAG TPA: serine/threonine-protein kinase, partial [Pirellulales bacterium]|nr:serine/threonine-protein kinase [Pirellulales bacterium]
MDSTAICPSAAEWDRLIAGSAPEHEIAEILRHVDDCAPCQQRLDRRGNLSVLVEREALGQAGEEFGPAFYRVVGGLFATQRTSQSAEATSPLLNRLLEPLDDPRYLGRLGQYRVVSVVGQGGMGIVFRAFDAVLNRDVALKVLSPHLAHEAIARERFAREARAAAAIDHENVMPIYAVSEAAGLPCLVMPYLLGRSLAEKLERTGRLPLVEVLRIGMQTALGLAAAHERGVVHRDIKPSNLLLEASEERVKIADFGLATVLDGVSLTQTGTLAGTPEFMSPEQAHEARVDTRSDLFSLGSVLFLMVTGQSPFRAVTPLATLRRVCDDVPPRVTELSTEATAWLAAVIERLLQKDPADRYQSAAEVAESLRYQIAAVSQPRRPPPRRVSCSSPGTDLSVAMPAVASLRAPSSSPDETDPLVALNPNTI